MTDKEPNIRIDRLRELYYDVKESRISENDVVENDITNLFFESLWERLEEGYLLNGGVRGEVISGKSTVAIALMVMIVNMLKKLGKLNDKYDLYSHIFSEQTEFIRYMTTEERDVCIMIDEFNKLAETGLNATTEGLLFEQYSDQFAQQMVHRISCSPSVVLDKNATFVLDVIGRDDEMKITRCRLSYCNIVDGLRLPVGRVDIDVSGVINQEFYKRYRAKKFRRMRLLQDYGIRDMREPEFAGLVLDVVAECSPVAKVKLVRPEVVLSATERIVKVHKRIYTEVVKQTIAARSRAILGMHTEMKELSVLLAKAKDPELQESIRDAMEKEGHLLKVTIAEEMRLKKIYDEYLGVK